MGCWPDEHTQVQETSLIGIGLLHTGACASTWSTPCWLVGTLFPGMQGGQAFTLTMPYCQSLFLLERIYEGGLLAALANSICDNTNRIFQVDRGARWPFRVRS